MGDDLVPVAQLFNHGAPTDLVRDVLDLLGLLDCQIGDSVGLVLDDAGHLRRPLPDGAGQRRGQLGPPVARSRLKSTVFRTYSK